MIFRQLFDRETCTYTYLLADPLSREATLIDPVIEHVERDLKLIKELDLNLIYLLETHLHADHVTGGGEIRKKTGARFGISAKAGVKKADIQIYGEETIECGSLKINGIPTPGHTSGCMSYYLSGSPGMVFTGDTLMIRGCGRTDFQEGSNEQLFQSVTTKLFTLPDETQVYPGHDYKGQTSSTIGEEKRHNPRLSQDFAHFESVMASLKLDDPARIDVALPANLNCGEI
jgi:glyoxylase-like metal-dependent hydrolase (beta-lactamase superfamily II)